MNISFSPSFFDSLKKIEKYNTWWYKTYEVFRYKIPWFIKNIYRFRKDLWKYRTYDYVYVLSMFKTSLEGLRDGIKNGNEVKESSTKKVQKIERVIRFLENKIADDYIERAEMEIGPIRNLDFEFILSNKQESEEDTNHNRKVFNRAREIQTSEWKEIWEIIKAQDAESYKNGSGMLSWWD